jgi:elongation factor P
MLDYNEITPKKVIIMDGEPYEVLTSWVFRKQMRKPVNQTKLRNIKTGSVTEQTFHQTDKVEEADLESKTIQFIYARNGEFWFMDPTNPRDRFTLGENVVGPQSIYLTANMQVEARVFEEEIIGLKLPIKMDLKVTEAPPDVRGNTAQGGNKVVTLETGATIQVPMFIHAGDVIRINTETNEYVERVTKA